ncbi:MAG: hypothetical protein U9R23_07420 [Candidatus Cloacimonadota bacterium]|nr:hypothetical protein [Candidatus Cloacimonadota bacterium]
MEKDKIIYSINIEDVQTVAKQELNRRLSDEELKMVETRLGDYIDWYEAINTTINEITKKI